ncbi:hypothetical protein BC940DRAFT_309564 [Gongronella butleri]|nr:hypothetical protein BC940DRAFT_309564 [Gongronella butleri]
MTEPAIKPIDTSTIHRLCSAQVIPDLASGIKELVENSLDAGATSIDIVLKNHGLHGFEVIDNGSGIDPSNYEFVALKHYTSKIADFKDLEHVLTFGFRGEALSSLCGVGRLVVTTATQEQAPMGVQLEYDHQGRLISNTPIARSVGTTVSVTQLFDTMPVRLQELKRTYKREYAKALTLIHAYCIISTNVRLFAYNEPPKGPRARLLSINGNSSLRDNLTNVFGLKVVSQLDPFDIDLAPTIQGSISGFISKPQFGLGRKSSDRQYFYINGRPCALPKISKAFNEVYSNFITNQYPVVVANLKIPTESYDVNVTPDKRNIMLHDEQILIQKILSALEIQFEPSRSTFDASPMVAGTPMSLTPVGNVVDTATTNEDEENGSAAPARRTISLVSAAAVASTSSSTTTTTRTLSISQLGALGNPTGRAFRPNDRSSSSSSSSKRAAPPTSTLNDYVKRSRPASSDPSTSGGALAALLAGMRASSASTTSAPADDERPIAEQPLASSAQEAETPMDVLEAQDFDEDTQMDENLQQTASSTSQPRRPLWQSLNRVNRTTIALSDLTSIWQQSMLPSKSQDQLNDNDNGHSGDDTTMASLTKSLKHANLDVNDNDAATRALSLVINKHDFVNMKILGQFNTGFIIAMLNQELFIIDQHAADEKYNFETLQQTTVIKGQKLIRPQLLELTSSEELLVMDNLDIFRANGFEIQVDEAAEPTQRIRIISQPASRNTLLDKRDIAELVHLIDENPGKMVRCSRYRAMFASKACRKSVMIGDPLKKSDMIKIVRHMGEINQPWNCPHGRPTMRHLMTLQLPQLHAKPSLQSRRHILSFKGSMVNEP